MVERDYSDDEEDRRFWFRHVVFSFFSVQFLSDFSRDGAGTTGMIQEK